MGKPHVKVILDTNVVVSAFIFGGKPEKIFTLILNKQIQAYTSPALLSELFEILIKKFNFTKEKVSYLEGVMRNNFTITYSVITINIQKDKDDNRVLEAALESNSDYIITGDKELLGLKSFKEIKIVTPDEFLKELRFV